MRKSAGVFALAVMAAMAVWVSTAAADFPYGTGAPHYRTTAGQTPNDIAGDDND